MLKADETYIAGNVPAARSSACAPGKIVVFGMLERDGDVMAKVVPDVKKKTLQPIVAENVGKGSTVHTDELRSYNGLSKAGYVHRTVNHGLGQYC